MKYLFTIVIIFLINGCATSNLSYSNKKLNLSINERSLQLDGVQLEEKHDNFSTLFLTQSLLRLEDGSIVVYEDARIDMQYRFDPSTPRSIKIIFDAKAVKKIYYSTSIYAFQVILKNNRVLNVLARQVYERDLKIVYGMSTEKLNSMLTKLDKNAQPAIINNVINLSHEPTPFISQWNIRKVHFEPLVVPSRRMGRL
jgi:hypothetical protein